MSLSASLQKIDHRVFIKGDHQAALAYLGQLALSDLSPAELAAQAAALITQVMPVEYSLLWELTEDRQNLLFKAGSGWLDGAAGLPPLSYDPLSLEGDTLLSPDPIIIRKSNNETQFSPLTMVIDQALVSGVSVRVGTIQKPYGIVQAFSTQEQYFSQNDIHFLQSVANIIGLVWRQEGCSLGSTTRLAEEYPGEASDYKEWDQYEIKNRLIESGERERLRLAQDLHDAPIQDLYGMIYQLDDLRDVLTNPEEIKVLDVFDHTLHRVVNGLRTICRELRPPSLYPFGLEVAIRDHVEKLRDQNPAIRVHLSLLQDKQVFSDSLRLTLFRIYQQAIHNVIRHAKATDIYIRFRWDQEKIYLEVEDNGRGFNVPRHWMELVSEEHFGLLGIAERVESVRGKLEIISSPGTGTVVRAIIPYS